MLLVIFAFVLPLPLLIWLFIRSKTRKAKLIIGTIAVLFTAFLTFMALGLWSMDIEDLYGDKQEIFWQGNSGDTVKLVDHNSQVLLATGILKKTWHRIKVESNGSQNDIVGWLEKETGLYYVETEQKFKDGVITITVDVPGDKAYFIGAYPDEVTLALDYIGENFVQYQLSVFCEHQMPTAERGLAKFQYAKKDTLIYKNSIDGNNLIISLWGKKGNKKAKVFKRTNSKKANLENVDYDSFREK